MEYRNDQVIEFHFIQKVIFFYIYSETFLKLFLLILNVISNEHSRFQVWPKFGPNMEYRNDQVIEFHFIQTVIFVYIYSECFIQILLVVINIIVQNSAEIM